MRVCVVCQSELGLTETFIQAHLQRIRAEILFLHGYGLDYTYGGRKLRDVVVPNQRQLIRRALQFMPICVEFRLRRRFLPQWTDYDVAVEFLHREAVDVVLAEYGTSAAFVTPVCKSAGVPLIAVFHGFDASRYEILRDFRDMYVQMFAYASSVVVVSRAMQQQLVGLGCHPQKLVVNPCGPDEIFFDIVPNYSSNIVLAVGRFVDKKAPHLTILAFAKSRERCPDLKLVMIGGGPLWGACRDLVHALGLVDHVELVGPKTPREVLDAMGKAFLFIQHSLTAADGDCEGTPVAVLEAAAAGLPVVATRHGGLCDVVDDGVTGALVNERDVQGMAAAIINYACNRNQAAKSGAAARLRVQGLFAMDQHIACIEKQLKMAVVAAQQADRNLPVSQ